MSVSATLEGAGGNPALRIEPASIDIGTVVVGEPSVEFQFDLSNIGFSPTEITSFEISGAHADDFEFASNNCVFRPLNPACGLQRRRDLHAVRRRPAHCAGRAGHP